MPKISAIPIRPVPPSKPPAKVAKWISAVETLNENVASLTESVDDLARAIEELQSSMESLHELRKVIDYLAGQLHKG